MFNLQDIHEVSKFLSTKEGKDFFRTAKKSPLNLGLSNDSCNSFALQDTFVHVLNNKKYNRVDNWSDSDFEWFHIARTTKAENIGRYLIIIIENMGYSVD